MARKKFRYTLTKKNGQYCTHNASTGNDIHCFKTRSAALQQLKALYASQGGGVKKDDKAMAEHLECFEDDCDRAFLTFEALGDHLAAVHPDSDHDQARMFNTKQRKAAASKGQAMKDGSFPIANEQDLKNAIQAFGRAKNKVAAKAHIIKRAKALGLTKLLPSGWTSDSSELVGCPDCDRRFLGDESMIDHADAVHTFDDIRQIVSEAVREAYGNADPNSRIYTWVNDIADDWCVFSVEKPNDMNLYKVPYTLNGTTVTLGDPVEVFRRTVYDAVSNPDPAPTKNSAETLNGI